MVKRVTKNELQEILGVGEAAFFRNYAKLMCPPVAKTSDGRGVRNYYSPLALERARWVRARRDDGYSLAEVAEMITRGEAPGCE